MDNLTTEIIVFDEDLVEERDYWVNRLTSQSGGSSLRTDRSQPAMRSGQRNQIEFSVNGGVYRELIALTGGSSFLIYVTLMTALKICLRVYTGNPRSIVGSPARRSNDDAEEAANLLAILDEIDEGGSFEQTLMKVRQTLLDAYARQRYPFYRLLKDLGMDGGDHGSPLFNIVMAMSDIHIELPELHTEITITLERKPEQLEAILTFDLDLYQPQTIERLIHHMQNILKMGLEKTDLLVRDLQLFANAERHQMLIEWNDSEAAFPTESCVSQLFEVWASAAPDATAVMDRDGHITYGKLNRRANQLANYLRALGVGPEVCVGLCVERSIEMVTGMLGILKAGGAYVPINPSTPPERLNFMLEDMQAPVVVTMESLLTHFPDTGRFTVCLDADMEAIGLESAEQPHPLAAAENAAYVIYTSGSTGQPKGVVIVHRAINRLVCNTNYLEFGRHHTMAQCSNIAFDASTFEIWGSLLNGGRLVILSKEELLSPANLAADLRRYQVSCILLTTALFNQMAWEEPGAFFALDYMLFGGEAVEPRAVREVLRHQPPRRLLHVYGPTESTVLTSWRLVREVADQETNVPIGRPISNTSVYLLDDRLRPVPTTLPAELFTGGHGLARAYLNRPDLTADRFLPDPFASLPGQRLYRTGDLVRARLDGAIDYLARRDEQVKLRGFRIELGEIETALKRHPSVRETVAVVRQDRHGHKQLVAYVALRPGASTPSASQWRQQLHQWLPEYMIPAKYVVLPRLPLTSNGKVDRQNLPEPQMDRDQDGYAPAETECERVLAAVWAEVLGLEQVGVEDNFFDLGGDSIRSIQVAARARERGVEVSIEELFDYLTIRELAAAIDKRGERVKREQVEELELLSLEDRGRIPVGIEDAYPLTRLQAGMLFHSNYEAGTAVYHNVLSYYLQAPFDALAMRAALDELTNRHAILRTSFDLTSYTESLQLVHRNVEAPMVVEDWSQIPISEQPSVMVAIEEEKNSHFDWTQAPLVRFRIIRRSEDRFHLIMVFHHAVLDGWSDALLITELFQQYWYLLGLSADRLEPPPRSVFRDYVALERRALQSEESRTFWRQKLSDSVLLELPRWPGAVRTAQTRNSQVTGIQLTPESLESLNLLARQAGAPLKSVLLAAHVWVLGWLSGRQDILTGLVAHGRTEGNDSERVAGLFLNAIPFRQQLCGGTWRELVTAVFDAEREILPHRWFPLDEIQRMLGRQYLFEVAFNFTHFHVYQGLNKFKEQMALLDERGAGRTNFTLMVDFSLYAPTSQLRLILTYDTAQLCAAQAETLIQYYARTLEALGAQPSGYYHSFTPLSAAERHHLLFEENDAKARRRREDCIHHLFEEQAARCPDAIAVLFADEQLSYRELNRRANQLGHYLQSLGVGAEARVGICIERSIRQVVAALGVLKAGGAYLPLDPAYPVERLRLMVEDSAAQVVVTVADLAGWEAWQGVRVVRLDAEHEQIIAEREDEPPGAVSGENLAYVVYTSGSTGQPKGVLGRHRGALNRFRWMWTQYPFEEGEVCCQKTVLSFVDSVWELFGPLLQGVPLAVIAEEAVRDTPELLAALTLHRVTRIVLVPSLLGAILDSLPQRRNGRLMVKTWVSSGEALPLELIDRFAALMPDARLLNLYGSSEVAADVTWFEASQGGTSHGVAIGRPVANTAIYLLDDEGRVVPRGTPGEIHVSGDGLARGYWNQPALTAAKFTPHPLSEEGGERVFRTGDLARRLPDGRIEYIGRRDHQVKLRGHRIELGEIEATLRNHPLVRESAVVARPDGSGALTLIAYYVSEGGAPAATLSELREFVRERLPYYMMPVAFAPLESLPLTPNGKLDRQALPDPDRVATGAGPEFIAPRTPVEELIAGIWSQVLNVEVIGARDNFFDLGGHSLLATQVVSRIRESIKLELPIRRLFESPTVESLSKIIESIQRDGDHAPAPLIIPVSRDQALPLSFAQQRLWFLDRLEPNGSFYNIPTAMRLNGSFAIAVAEQGLTEIYRRHEILRTIFVSNDGQPLQQILPETKLDMPSVDLSGLSPELRQGIAKRLIGAATQRPFALAQGPLIRVSLLRMGAHEHVLQMTIHHIVIDGWSMSILMENLLRLYEPFGAGNPSPLSELAIQYADYAHWQRQRLAGDRLERELHYWKEQLAGAPAILELPTDRPRPPVQTYRGARRSLVFPERLTRSLKALSRRQSVTLFMSLVASFKALLYRYTGQTDIMIGTPIAARNSPEIEEMIGYFAGTLVLRTDLSGRPAFSQLVRRVCETALGAYTHQNLPFEKLVEALRPERNLSHNPLFQVLLALHKSASASVNALDLKLVPIQADTLTTRFDLALDLQETGSVLAGSIEYSTDLFDDTTIARMIAHWETMLGGITEYPERPITILPLLTEAEGHQLLISWNETETTRTRGYKRSLHDLIMAQAARIPDAVALVDEDGHLTYRELDRRSNRLAWYLRGIGSGRGVVVGICLDRTLELVVAMLGALKTDAAYVPLDPTYPTERLALMAQDSHIPLLLTTTRLTAELPVTNARVVYLDIENDAITTKIGDYSPSGGGPTDLAYVIYTSGSTGRPKGVEIGHESIVNLLETAGSFIELDESDIWTATHSYGFDLSVWEIYAALVYGGRLIIVPRSITQEPAALNHLVQRERVTVFNQTPTSILPLTQIREAAADRELALRAIICGGEALPGELAARAGNAWGVKIWNFYGPTEATVWSSFKSIAPPDQARATVPVGRPWPGLGLYILDVNGEAAPIGAPGELHIGGIGLARGYLGQPDLTAEKFIPHPSSLEPGARVYRTGDLARYLSHGDVEFLGRADYQVKIRGFRVELGEIEAAIASHPAVDQAVVVMREVSRADQRLFAYIVPRPGLRLSINELQSYVRVKLPDHMIPAALVQLASLPHTTNGKIDRRALPMPDQQLDLARNGRRGAPRTSEESILAALFADVLGIEEVGTHDNFFNLGGHSLLATQLVSRVREALGVELPLRRLFETPTVAGLAGAMEELRIGGSQRKRPSLDPVSRNQELPLSFAQQRLWFLDQLEPGSALYNLPVALRLKGTLNLAALEQSFSELVRRHEVLRTTFAMRGTGPAQVIHPAGRLILPIAEPMGIVGTNLEAATARLATAEAKRPFDLVQGPMIRFGLLRLGPDDHVMIFTMHHVISDAWSTGILAREIVMLYEAFAGGIASELPELTIQYADFAYWERKHMTGEALEAQLAYWKQQLKETPPLLELPTDRVRPSIPSYKGGSVSFELSRELTESLKSLSRREGVTLFMTLLGAYQTLLFRYSEQSDFIIGANIANRNRGETESLIGFFVNMLLMRARLTGAMSFRELLRHVREVSLGAYANQDLPFEKLVEYLQPERNLNQSPLFRVVFNFDNAPPPTQDLPGLAISPLITEGETSRFDLTLLMREDRGGLQGAWKYSVDLFDAATITRLTNYFIQLLSHIVEQPDARLNGLNMLPEAERQQRNLELRQREESNVQHLRAAKRKSIRLPAELRDKRGDRA